MQCMLFGYSAEHKQDLLGMATQGSVGAGLTEAGLITPEVAVQTEAFKKSVLPPTAQFPTLAHAHTGYMRPHGSNICNAALSLIWQGPLSKRNQD